MRREFFFLLNIISSTIPLIHRKWEGHMNLFISDRPSAIWISAAR
jgi:hypothetical protein